MADTLASLMQGMDAAGSLANSGVPHAIEQGMGLARQQQDLEQKKIQLQASKDELDTKRSTGLLGIMQTVGKMPEGTYKYASQAVKDRFQKLGGNPDVLDYIQADPARRRNIQDIGGAIVNKLPTDPNARNAVWQASADVLGLDGAIELGNKLVDRESKEAQAEAKLETAEKIANVKAAGSANTASDKEDARLQRQYNSLHAQNIAAIDRNPLLKQKIQQYTNLINARDAFTRGKATPQQFDELQQAVRSNLGIKGGSGVDERALTQLGWATKDIQALGQWLSGKPQDITKYGGQSMVNHVLDLVNIETGNVKNQFEDSLAAATAGREWIYDERPDLKASLHNKLGLASKQLTDTTPTGRAAAAGAAGQPPAPPKNIQADLAKLKSAGAKPEQILSVLKRAGHTNAEIAAALRGGQ